MAPNKNKCLRAKNKISKSRWTGFEVAVHYIYKETILFGYLFQGIKLAWPRSQVKLQAVRLQ